VPSTAAINPGLEMRVGQHFNIPDEMPEWFSAIQILVCAALLVAFVSWYPQ
jgi:hypothetical protein